MRVRSIVVSCVLLVVAGAPASSAAVLRLTDLNTSEIRALDRRRRKACRCTRAWTSTACCCICGPTSSRPANYDYFTTAYFHRPDELPAEQTAAGFERARMVGVEGAGWILPDFDARWSDPAQRGVILDTARILEEQPSVVGISAHLLGLGWKP